MVLKVLLADDSAAIKKIVQLSLQDFGVELKTVSSGKDTLDVARQFKPDIAFVDVLLPHKSGYEVVSEIKNDPSLKQTPVVMLWSSFMAFDENKFKASGANEKLEKPFEVSGLRSLVTRLVQKLQSSPLAKHLDFPKMEAEIPIGSVPPAKKPSGPQIPPMQTMPQPPTMPSAPSQTMKAPGPKLTFNLPKAPTSVKMPPHPEEEHEEEISPFGVEDPSAPLTVQPLNVKAPISLQEPAVKEEWSMASFEDIASFAANVEATPKPSIPEPLTIQPPAAPLPPPVVIKTQAPPANTGNPTPLSIWSNDNDWIRKDLGKFRVPIPDEGEEDTVSFQYTEEPVQNTDFLFKPPGENTNPAFTPSNIFGEAQGPTPAAQAPTAQAPLQMQTPVAPQPAITLQTQPIQAPVQQVVQQAPPQVQAPVAPAAQAGVPWPENLTQEISDKLISELKGELKAETRDIIEKAVWKLVPEIASQLIKEELSRLINNQEL